MTGRTLPSTGVETAENELLAQLGLPPSASAEDVDDLHLAVSQYLAAAPAEIRGWAHTQAAALDRTYLTLTDPVGLQGSALRSPAGPPAVVPGGPATPPARRGSAPAVPPPVAAAAAAVAATDGSDESVVDEPGLDDYEALYASVTPSAHADMGSSAAPRPKETKPAAAAPVAATTMSAPATSNPWKRVAIGTVALVAVLGIAVGGYALGGGGTTPPVASQTVAQASSGAPAVDEAKVAGLMAKYQADPTDVVSLTALADEFYAGGQYETAGTWLDKILALEPENIQALLAKGAIAFNTNDLPAAEATWKKVVGIDPENVEAHYDLGFLYLNSATPDWTGVQREWKEVIRLDPGSDLAKTVDSHLASLEMASMIPAASPAGSPAASPVASPAASPAASTQP